MVSIVIPAFNEEQATEKVLNEIGSTMSKSNLEHEIIFVDDGSYDKTAQIVSEFPDVCLIKLGKNRGVGVARKTGLKEAKGEIVIMIDDDGTYPTEAISELIQNLRKYDMVIGWRQNEVKSPTFLYVLLKSILNKVVSLLMGKRIFDLNSGLRAFKKDKAIQFLNILPDSHSWVSTLTISFLASGYEVGYIPIYCRKRIGKSSFRFWIDGWKSLVCITRAIVYFKVKERR